MEPCPSHACTVVSGTPRRIHSQAAVCRRSCNVRPRPTSLQPVCRTNIERWSCPPPGRVSSRSSGLLPSAKRRSAGTSASGTGTRRPLPDFGVVAAAVPSGWLRTTCSMGMGTSMKSRTGIRWGEARAMLVRDFIEVPMPMLHVVRNQPEGTAAATTPKSGRGRRVPVPDALVPALRRFAEGKSPDDLLLTRPGGGQLHRSMFVRQTGWSEVGRGRTLHDLRHTAACEWILRGVPLTTVQAWLGHGSIEVTARYLHHLGDSADRSALQLLNDTAARALTVG